MYKFIMEIDPDNEFSKSRVIMEIPDPDINLNCLLVEFKGFLKACGFSDKQVSELIDAE